MLPKVKVHRCFGVYLSFKLCVMSAGVAVKVKRTIDEITGTGIPSFPTLFHDYHSSIVDRNYWTISQEDFR